MNHDRSEELFARARVLIPAGVNSPVRSFGAVGGTPPFITRGHGSYIWDVDDNQYLDFVGSWGPLILGHAHQEIVSALTATILDGTSFGAPTEMEIRLAELISAAMPSMEMMRLVSSGTEATMSAIRLARAFTNRSKVLKFNGNYHGHSDGLLVKAGSGLATQGIPSSAGVPTAYASETLVAEYNDLASVDQVFRSNVNQVAAIIVEPVAGNMGVIAPEPGFLEGLRAIADDTGALLIFDEVITGFRVAYGGAQGLYGVRPDLTCLGKIIGGGLPVGAYGGRREVMGLIAPLGGVYQAGTLSGNPLAVAAGVACLEHLSAPGAYANLETLADQFESGFRQAAIDSGRNTTINRVGSMMTGFFNSNPVRTWADAAVSDTDAYAAFFHGLLERGIYIAPSQFESAFLSLAHSSEDIQYALDQISIVLKETKAD